MQHFVTKQVTALNVFFAGVESKRMLFQGKSTQFLRELPHHDR